jgi:hypothetical protein
VHLGRGKPHFAGSAVLLDQTKAGGRESSQGRSTATRAMFNEHSEVELEVNDVGNVEAVVYQTDVTANDDVAVVSWAGWQAIEKVSGHGMDTMPHIVIEDDADLKARFDFRRQSVPIAESLREPVVVFADQPRAASRSWSSNRGCS